MRVSIISAKARRRLAAGFFCTLGLVALAACGGGGGGGHSPPPAPSLSSITVTPAGASIAAGATQQFVATGTYSDGSTRVLTTSATWSTSSPAVATIDTGGLATAVAAGGTTIGAASGAVTGSTTLTVTAATLQSISIEPTNAVLGYGGATQQFAATGHYSDSTTRDLSGQVTWASSDAAVIAVGADGFARAVASTGTATVRAALGSITGSTAVSLRTATVTGSITIPDSDMGWKPSIYDLQAKGGGRVRVLGTDLVAVVTPDSATTGTFSLTGVPLGTVTLILEEGSDYDVFTQASKRSVIDVDSTSESGAGFSLVYHWEELAGYPPPWNTMNTQGPVGWKAQFVSDQVAFVAFRRDVPNDRIELYRTTNRGASWTMVGQWIYDPAAWAAGQPYPGYWQEFYFLDANRGVMHATAVGIPCDTGAGYFYTANGGQTWTFTPLPMTPTGYHTAPAGYARIGDSRIVVVGRVGCAAQGYTAGMYDAIWESPDAGATWTLAWHSTRDEWGTFNGVDANATGRAVAFRAAQAQHFMVRNTAGTWTAQASGGIANDSRDVAMVDNRAWIMNTKGSAPLGTYRSADSGYNWAKVSDGLLQDFDFASSRKGYAQAGGPAYVTYDGGETWRYQSAGGAIWPGVMDIWAFDRTHAAWAEVGFGDPNGVGQLFTYVEPAQSSVEVTMPTRLADLAVVRGSTGVPLASYRGISHGPTPVGGGTISLKASGTLNDATHVTAVRVWLDRDGDGTVDADDTQLVTGVFPVDNGTVVMTVLPAGALEQLSPANLLVTCDLSAAMGYSGTFRVHVTAADFTTVETGTSTTVLATAPTGYVLTSRTLTVTP